MPNLLYVQSLNNMTEYNRGEIQCIRTFIELKNEEKGFYSPNELNLTDDNTSL